MTLGYVLVTHSHWSSFLYYIIIGVVNRLNSIDHPVLVGEKSGRVELKGFLSYRLNFWVMKNLESTFYEIHLILES